LDDAKCGGAKEISRRIITRSTREGKTDVQKETHTEKTDEAFGGLQEGEGVDALIGDGDVGEGLGKKGSSGQAWRIKRL
jgi:hypothetical protein